MKEYPVLYGFIRTDRYRFAFNGKSRGCQRFPLITLMISKISIQKVRISSTSKTCDMSD